MTQQFRPRLEAFLSLFWYETLLSFIANFVAKSSEILLTAGLVVSSANFLTDGSLLREGTPFAIAWAWTQAVAIDGSLGTSFYAIFSYFKKRDWVKGVLSSILTTLLTLVAWSVTEGDIFSHAANVSINESMQLVGIDARLLSTLRAIAVVGFVLMSRLHDDPQPQHAHQRETSTQPSPLTASDIEHIVQTILQRSATNMVITEERENHFLMASTSPNHTHLHSALNTDDAKEKSATIEEGKPQSQIEGSPDLQPHSSAWETTVNTDEERLLQAYLELQQANQKISGRALAQRAHLRRSRCLQWLQTYQNAPKNFTDTENEYDEVLETTTIS